MQLGVRPTDADPWTPHRGEMIMQPGGMMPVIQLITLIRNTPPRGAAGLLAAMPADRLPVVVAEMRTADIARVLPATRTDLRDTLIAALSADQLTELVRTIAADQAVNLLPVLPSDRLASLVDSLPDPFVSDLLTRMPTTGQSALLAAMPPRRAREVLARTYERNVAAALTRGNANVTVAQDPPRGILLVQNLGWRIVVAARYGDDGRVAIRDAEETAYRLRAHGALAVTDHQPGDDVARYCRESQRQGRPIGAVAWTAAQDDNAVKRTLVGLFQ
jgi:MgtE intracellular N domain